MSLFAQDDLDEDDLEEEEEDDDDAGAGEENYDQGQVTTLLQFDRHQASLCMLHNGSRHAVCY